MHRQSGFVQILFIFILLAGIGLAVYLTQFTQVFKPKASENPIDPETFRLQNPKSDLQKYLNPFGEAWEAKLRKNPDIPNMITATFDRTVGASVGRGELKPDGTPKYPDLFRQKQFNRFLPEYFNADPWNVYPKPNVTYSLDLSDGYENILKKANTDLNIIGGGNGRASSKLYSDMPVFKIVQRETKKINPNLKSYGYYVINFTEEKLMAGYPDATKVPAQEAWFVHRKGTDPTKMENRLVVANEQYVIDVTNPQLQDFMAQEVAKSMQDNGVDMILVDGSGFGTNRLVTCKVETLTDGNIKCTPEAVANVYPDYFTPQAYFEGTKQTLGKIKAKLNPLGKQVYFNPITPDVLDDNRVEQVRQYLTVTDGSYWEDPFRLLNRDYFAQNGDVDNYYNILQKFFDLFKPETGKKLIVETNTVRNLETVANINLTPDPVYPEFKYYCKPEFICEYQKAINEFGQTALLKEEQRIARLNLGMYLLFMDPQNTFYKHHTLMEELSYETSEDFWADYDLQIGKPYGPKEKVTDNVYRRIFDNAQVWVNYSDQPYTLPNGALPCDDFHQNVCRTPHYVTAEGVPVTSYTLPPLSAMIFGIPWIIDAYNPSFETVWNWKPNQENWGSIDYEVFHTGRRSHKIQSGLSGSPGLGQKFNFLPNTTYTWSAWVKTRDNQNSNTVAVMIPGGVTSSNKISEGRFVYDDIVPTGTNDWKKIQMTFNTSQGGQGYLYSALQNGSNGTVWFDDIKLTEGSAITDPNFTDKTVAYCNGTTSRIHLEWNQVPGVSGYYIYRGQGQNPIIKIADTTNYAYNDDGVTPGTSDTYRIEAQVGPSIISGQSKTLTAVACLPSPSPAKKVGDLNNDGSVDALDFGVFIGDYRDQNLRSDFNNNGEVDIFDFNIFIQNLGH